MGRGAAGWAPVEASSQWRLPAAAATAGPPPHHLKRLTAWLAQSAAGITGGKGNDGKAAGEGLRQACSAQGRLAWFCKASSGMSRSEFNATQLSTQWHPLSNTPPAATAAAPLLPPDRRRKAPIAPQTAAPHAPHLAHGGRRLGGGGVVAQLLPDGRHHQRQAKADASDDEAPHNHRLRSINRVQRRRGRVSFSTEAPGCQPL